MFSGYYQPQDNIASVIPCSPKMSIRTTIADGLYLLYTKRFNYFPLSAPGVLKRTHPKIEQIRSSTLGPLHSNPMDMLKSVFTSRIS